MEKEGESRKKKIVVLYGSQTGNAYDVADRVSREAERRRCSVSVISLHHFDAGSLPELKTVIFVVSTTGQGDAPDSMKSFWRKLLQRNLGGKWLEGVQYAVFGLGDSGYQKYNQRVYNPVFSSLQSVHHLIDLLEELSLSGLIALEAKSFKFVAKKLDKRLVDLGATAIVEKGLGDDQHPLGYEGALDPWMSSLWTALYQNNPKFFPEGLNPLATDMKWTDQCKFQVIYHDPYDIISQSSNNSDIKHLQMQIEMARSMSPGKFPHDKHRPDCLLKMVRNYPLTITHSEKDVRHFEFEPVSSIIDYEVGDVVEILPGQGPASVDAFIERCNLNPEAYISVHPRGADRDLLELNVPVKLKTLVEFTMDVASASPRRYFFEVMSYFASAEHERERLQYFVSPEGRDDLYQYNQKERRTVLEVLEDFPSVQMPFEWLVQLVPPLKTRAFSISSSHSVHPNQVHLTVSVVSWTTPFKRKRTGLCSSWLAGLNPQINTSEYVPVWFQKGSLPPPPPSLPLILVGPGTGCAPFRGFIEKRALESKTRPVSPTLFFFGCRNENNDFLYKDFWLFQSEKGGVLSEDRGGGFCVAFSRDQSKKVYVQHKIREYSERIWGLLQEGAAVYVAGSSTKMPSDVFSAFEEIVSRESGVSREAAATWLKALEKAGKYNVEAWS